MYTLKHLLPIQSDRECWPWDEWLAIGHNYFLLPHRHANLFHSMSQHRSRCLEVVKIRFSTLIIIFRLHTLFMSIIFFLVISHRRSSRLSNKRQSWKMFQVEVFWVACTSETVVSYHITTRLHKPCTDNHFLDVIFLFFACSPYPRPVLSHITGVLQQHLELTWMPVSFFNGQFRFPPNHHLYLLGYRPNFHLISNKVTLSIYSPYSFVRLSTDSTIFWL